jgi:hypothetical protein
MVIDDLVFGVPPGGFERIGPGERYVFRDQFPEGAKVTIEVDFTRRTWSLLCSQTDCSGIDNFDSIDVILLIGNNAGSVNVLMEEQGNRLLYQYPLEDALEESGWAPP